MILLLVMAERSALVRLFLILSSGASAGATMKICERNIALNARFVLLVLAAAIQAVRMW